jgi:hypothetical protein
VVQRGALVVRHPGDEADRLEVARGHRERRDRVAERLVEAVVGAVLVEEGQVHVGVLVVVVAELVVDRDEVLLDRR